MFSLTSPTVLPFTSEEPGYPVRVEDPAGCDRFTALAVRGINPTAQSPDWMKRRLTLAGIRSISLPVDITNYLMLELGQPMHAFDLGRLSGELVVRRARAGEKLTTLDGADRVLDGRPVGVQLQDLLGRACRHPGDVLLDHLADLLRAGGHVTPRN